MSEFVYRGPDGQPINKENYEKWAETYDFPQIPDEAKEAGAYLKDKNGNITKIDITKEEFYDSTAMKKIVEELSVDSEQIEIIFTDTSEKIEAYEHADDNFYYDNEVSCKCILNLPNVKDIGAGALENQVHISEIYINDTDDIKIGEGAFSRCAALEHVHLPEQLKEIPDKLFAYDYRLDRLKIPQETERIGNEIFEYCEMLSFAHIPRNVKEIGDRTFLGCSNICDISFLYNNSLETIGNQTFEECGVDNNMNPLILPDSVTNIGYKTFSGMTADISVSKETLKNISIEKTFEGYLNGMTSIDGKELINEIEDVANDEHSELEGTGIIPADRVSIDSYPSGFMAHENVKIDNFDQFKSFMTKTPAKELENYRNEVVEAVHKVICSPRMDYDGSVRQMLENISIKGIANIVNKCPDEKELKNIGVDAIFKELTKENEYKLKGIKLLDKLPEMEKDKVQEAMDSIQNAQKSLNVHSFDGTADLRGMDIPDKILEVKEEMTQNVLGPDAFGNTNNLGNIKLLEKLALEEIDLSNERRVDDDAFAEYTNLKKIKLSDDLESIGCNAFRDCKSITNLFIPDSVENIGNGAFAGCENLCEIDASEKLLANIDIDSVFEGTGLDMDKMHAIADNYREEHQQEFDDMDDIENEDIDDEDHDDL